MFVLYTGLDAESVPGDEGGAGVLVLGRDCFLQGKHSTGIFSRFDVDALRLEFPALFTWLVIDRDYDVIGSRLTRMGVEQ